MPMHVRALPAFTDNYIWTFAVAGGCAVVDPGQAAPVIDFLAGSNQPLCAILITHHHPDHIGGVADLRQRWPDCQVFAPDDARAGERTRTVREGDRITLAEDCHFTVIEVPGHTRSHIAFVGDGVVFCGDTLFSLGCGRMFEGTPAQFLTSLDRLSALPADTRLFCTHEYTLANARYALAVDPSNDALKARVANAQRQRQAGVPTLPTTIADECACNPFLRTRASALQQAAEQRSGRAQLAPAEVFATLRAWKDVYA